MSRINPDQIPPELRSLRQWHCWNLVDGKKIPVQINGQAAKSNDPETWTDFETAIDASQFHSGLAFEISDPYTGIDLDNCLDESGNLRDWALPIVAKLKGIAYAEVSPSRVGIKMLTRGRKPGGARCTHKISEGKQQIEVYDHARFWTFTGDVYAGQTVIADGQMAVNWICENYLTAKQPSQQGTVKHATTQSGTNNSKLWDRALAYADSVPGESKGNLRNAAFNLSGHLHAFIGDYSERLTDAEVLELLTIWNQKNNPPLKGDELCEASVNGRTNGTPREDKLPGRSNSVLDNPDTGSLLNFKTEGKSPFPLNMTELVAQVRNLNSDWPRVCDGQLFVPDSHSGVRWIDKPAQLIAYLTESLHNPPKFNRGAGFIQESVLFEHLKVCQQRYEAIEFAPHEPGFENRYYACNDIEPGDGQHLQWILDRFEPETAIDGDLIKAFLATTIWGGDGGARPCFAITAPDRGAGKSTLVRIAGELTGGLIDIAANENIDTLKARLLSAEGRRKRVAVMDNAKSRKLSSPEFESLITAAVISGRQNYVGEGSRPNSITWCITMNGLALSRDMAQRSVIIQLAIPRYDGLWQETTMNYVREHRNAILGDLIAFLRGPQNKLRKYTRWGSWERYVLRLLPDPSQAQSVIVERQGGADVDDEETALISEHFAKNLQSLGYATETDSILIPSRVATQWYTEAIGSRDLTQTKAARDLNQKIDAGMLPSLHHMRRNDLGRGWIWSRRSGLPPADTWQQDIDTRIEQRDIDSRSFR